MTMSRNLLLCFTLAAAACADRGLDETGPVRDATAPRIDVRAPARGSILQDATAVEIRGTVSDDRGVAKLTVNGLIVQPAADGTFSARVAATPGLTFLHTVVTDVDGNSQSDTRAVLSGPLVPVESTVRDALVTHLDQQAWRIGSQLAGRALTGLDLAPLVMDLNPIVNIPVPCLGARVDVTRVGKGAVSASLVPVDGGLEIDASIRDIDVGVKVAYDVGCDPGVAEPSVTASAFRIHGVLKLSVDADGKVAIDARQTEAYFEGFRIDSAVLPREVTDFLQGPIGAALATVVADQVAAQLPELVGEMLGGKDRVFEVAAETVTIGVRPTTMQFDATGSRIVADTRVFLHGAPGSVFLSSPKPRPSFATTPSKSIHLGIADDAMNQILSSVWGAGVLDQTFVVDTASSYAGVGVLFDRVELALRLPPVLTAMPDGGGLQIAVGDVECHFIKARPGEPLKTVTRLSMSAETRVTATVKDNRIALVATEPVVWLDVLSDGVSGSNPLNQESVRQLGSFAARNLVGMVTDMVGELPIPAVEGMTIVDAQATTGESSGGYLMVSGNVAVK